ncbi:MAG: hypothetical protein ACOC8K_08905, partial [Gemmatimonadota bacterium]
MSVTRAEVERIAGLARLELGDEEAESLRDDLNGILEHMETLAEAPAAEGAGPVSEGVGPAGGSADGRAESEAHRDGPTPFREDGEAMPDSLELSPGDLAPGWQDGF